MSSQSCLVVVSHTEHGEASVSLVRVLRPRMKGKSMKKAKSTTDELRPEYKRSDFKKLERGKYYKRVKASSNVVVLDPELAAVFPNSDVVNRTLHSLVEVAQSVSGLTTGSNRPNMPLPSTGKPGS
ncbi:hypothetical protein CCP4SC76_390017 [Gammaproteobacteria bacterium]